MASMKIKKGDLVTLGFLSLPLCRDKCISRLPKDSRRDHTCVYFSRNHCKTSHAPVQLNLTIPWGSSIQASECGVLSLPLARPTLSLSTDSAHPE